MATVVKHLKMSGSGLDVKTRMWLKITIPNAFIGSDLVDWLQQKVHGLAERRDARKYASSLLKAGYIRHTVNKITFSEQCYYVFGEYTGQLERDMSSLSLVESNSDRDSDALGPLGGGWGGQPGHGYPSYHVPYPGQLSVGPPGMNGNSEYAPPIPPYSSVPPHRNYPDDVSVHSMHRAASEASSYRHHLATFGAGNSSTESESRCSNRSGKSSGSKRRSDGDRNSDTHSQVGEPRRNMTEHHTLQRPSAMNSTPGHLRSSQLSFQQAMGHPCDYFVDVM
uniref:DEP domain-containing protein n=1 Tax=Ciona savignyi TaxID=51511 RepID=H2ZCX4_CIOSA